MLHPSLTPRWLVIRGRLADALEVIHGLREGGGAGRQMPARDRSTAEVEAGLSLLGVRLLTWIPWTILYRVSHQLNRVLTAK